MRADSAEGIVPETSVDTRRARGAEASKAGNSSQQMRRSTGVGSRARFSAPVQSPTDIRTFLQKSRRRGLQLLAAGVVAVALVGCGNSTSSSAGDSTPSSSTASPGVTTRPAATAGSARIPARTAPPSSPLVATTPVPAARVARPSATTSTHIRPTSLQSVAYAYDRALNPFNGDADVAWSLVDPGCRPASQLKQLKQLIGKFDLTRIPKRARAAVLKTLRQRAVYRVRPLDVVYDGQSGPRTPLASTPDNGATGAVIFFYTDPDNPRQTSGITRFIKHGSRWWVDLRSGSPDASSSSAFTRQTLCPQ
jgi:hypothetical protein